MNESMPDKNSDSVSSLKFDNMGVTSNFHDWRGNSGLLVRYSSSYILNLPAIVQTIFEN